MTYDNNTPDSSDTFYLRNNGLQPLDKLDRPPNMIDILDRMPDDLSAAMYAIVEDSKEEDKEKEKKQAAKVAKEKAAQEQAAEQSAPDLGDMTDMLERLNAIGDLSAYNGYDTDSLLHAQAQMLNNLFARTIHKAQTSRYSSNHLELALKIQKQAVETLRVRGGLEYMKSITQVSAQKAYVGAPPSPQIVKQTEFD